MLLECAETDWLGSRNYFYNTRTNQISDNINDLIDPSHIDFHPEGLRNYLDYGFSAFGQTPLVDIKYLKANETIEKKSDGQLVLKRLEDPFEKTLGKPSNPSDTIEYLHYISNKWADKQAGIILPTSSGFDSRLLNVLLDDKSKIHAFTYGISNVQEESIETVFANELCRKLGIEWQMIQLGDYHMFIDYWYSLYGVSTHAHGMYHMEFYRKIRELINDGAVLSGIFGDVWAGNWEFDEITSEKNVNKLFVTHDLSADSYYCKLEEDHSLREEYFNENKEKLKTPSWRVLLAGRNKIILISYLLRMAEWNGFSSWSPFLDETAVAMMLNLDPVERKRRKWQVDYFGKKGVLVGEWNLSYTRQNTLDWQAYQRRPLKDLNTILLSELFEIEYLERINEGVKSGQYDSKWIKNYASWLTLFPIQKLLEFREKK